MSVASYVVLLFCQQPGPQYEIPVTKCPAYVPTSEQEGGRVEEAVYEPV